MKVYKSKLIDENNIKKTYKLGLREFCILLIVSLLCNQALYATDKSEHINNISQNTNVIIGVVTDSQNGDPIIGATIKIKGRTTGNGRSYCLRCQSKKGKCNRSNTSYQTCRLNCSLF